MYKIQKHACKEKIFESPFWSHINSFSNMVLKNVVEQPFKYVTNLKSPMDYLIQPFTF